MRKTCELIEATVRAGHFERSEESPLPFRTRSFASLRMT